VDDLIAAKKVAGSLGGTDKAIAALRALQRFEDTAEITAAPVDPAATCLSRTAACGNSTRPTGS